MHSVQCKQCMAKYDKNWFKIVICKIAVVLN